MAQPCTAILIDPIARIVTEVTWNGHYQHIAQLTDCDRYDCAYINPEGDGIFVDDDGLFREQQFFFKHEDYPQPLAGKGLVLGCDAEGESVTPHTTLEEVRKKVRFVVPVRINGGDVTWLDA